MDEYYSVIQFLPEPLRTELKAMPPECAACVQEIRLRAGQAVQFTVGGAWQPAQQLLPAAQTALAIGPRMLRSCFAALCRDSAYAYEDELKQGYFTLPGGSRVGVAGVCGPAGFADITSLNLRVARQVPCVLPPQLRRTLDALNGGILVVGTPGSGKSYAVVNSFIKQQIEKGFSQYIYDFKYPDLSTIAYNHLLNHPDGYKVKPKFYVINFDDPRRSHRCNPIHPDFMEDITDAYESAYTIMLNLNKTWVQKQGDFFVESPIILFASIIWYLKIYQNGKFCTFPHAIEFLNRRYEDIFPILTSYPELENYLSPFMDAWLGGAAEQLMGQIASAKIPLSRMISPQLYWVMSDSEFTLDINNPEEPKILCVGNNPDRQNIYGAALGLYNSRIVKLINKKGMLKSSVIIDELPTIYFKGLDNLIATARSNKVAVCLGFQDFSQLVRDYGDKEAKVVMNTVGNIFSGQVVGETAKTLSERFGKVLQKRQSISINRQDVSTSINTQMDALIPPSKISGLTQGMFVGSVSDNFNERIEQKIFHCEIVVDAEKVKREESAYKKIPVITDFTDEDGNDHMKETVQANYRRIKEEVKQIVQDELERIAGDDNLKHLLQQK